MVIKPLADEFAPYASANSVIKVIQQYRSHGLPDPLTQTGLEQIGLPPSMASFTLRSLVFLALWMRAAILPQTLHVFGELPLRNIQPSLEILFARRISASSRSPTLWFMTLLGSKMHFAYLSQRSNEIKWWRCSWDSVRRRV